MLTSPSPARELGGDAEDEARESWREASKQTNTNEEHSTLRSLNSPADESPEPPLSVLGASIETPLPSDDDALPRAEDLSQGRFGVLLSGRSLEGLGFHRLQVLSLAGSAVKTEQLGMVLAESRQLRKLDASQCRLVQTPAAELFANLTHLAVLFLHKNHLARWDDLERAVQAPALAWLTAFENPIASQPEFRHFVIGQKPRIVAVDHWVVTDGEHLGFTGGSHGPSHGSRFAVQNRQSVINLRSHLVAQTPHALLMEAQEELWSLQHKSNRCSAACCIQTAYRASSTRRQVAKVQKLQLRALMMVQRRARTFLWRRRMLSHLKDYLAEIDELDLLLSAKEMLRLRAAKLIEVAVRQWINRRNQWKMVRKAAECVNRATRGFLARRYALRNHLELQTYQRIYFPEEYTWEFLVMLNIVRRNHGLDTFPRDHKFKPADVVGIRIPDTDEVPRRDAALMAVVRFAQHCIVRPLRNNRRDRYPKHEWDGPFHTIVDKSTDVCKCATLVSCKCSFQAKINRAYTKIRQRGANVDSRCRRIFKMSCCPDQHPIHKPSHHEEPDPDQVSLVLKGILEGPEENWPREAQNEGTSANMFMCEARELGSRPRRSCGPGKGIYDSRAMYRDPETDLPCYRNATWLSQRLLYHECSNEKIALDMLLLLVRLSRDGMRIPMVKPVPFLAERDVRLISAVTVIQSAWRAHCLRCSLASGLRRATVLRRAAICIQRGWRWGLMKRRLELLTGAAKYVDAVKSTTLYVEDRLYTALNVIGSIDRYPPLLQERTLGLGYIEGETSGSIVLVRPDLRGMSKMKSAGASKEAKEAMRKRAQQREGGLPTWFLKRVGELRGVGPDDALLVKVSGVQGILKEGLGDRPDDVIQDISMASIKHAAKLAADAKDETSPALVASAGNFQFRELRFHSLAQAKQRALLLYLTTFNAQNHVVVPLLSRSMLHDVSMCQNILRLWDLFGLTWPAGDRAARHLLTQKGTRPPSEVVPLSGNQPMRHIGQGEWQTGSSNDKKFSGWIERRAKIQEETRQRYAFFAKQYEERQQRDIHKLRRRLQETSVDRLQEGPAPGAIDACVTGALPPIHSSRVQENPAAVIHLEKLAAKALLQEAKEIEEERVRLLHDSVFESRREKEAVVFKEEEERIRAFHDEHGNDDHAVWEEQKYAAEDGLKEKNQEIHLMLAHKKAENDIIARSQMIMKKSALNHITPRDMKEFKAEMEKQQEEEHELAREKRQREKIAKAGRKQAAKNVEQFLTKSKRIQHACRRFDAGRHREERIHYAQTNADHHRELWAQRAASLAACQEMRQQFKLRQVDDLKRQLEVLREQGKERQQMELHQARWHIKAQKSLDSFLKAAYAELEQPADNVSARFRETYERAVQSFQELGVDVQQLDQAMLPAPQPVQRPEPELDDEISAVNSIDEKGYSTSSWRLLGWEPRVESASEGDNASANFDSSLVATGSRREQMVAGMLAHVGALQNRTSSQQLQQQQLFMKTNSSPLEPWVNTGVIDFDPLESAEPLEPTSPALGAWRSPPPQPAFATPKPSPLLPPRGLRPAAGTAQKPAQAAEAAEALRAAAADVQTSGAARPSPSADELLDEGTTEEAAGVEEELVQTDEAAEMAGPSPEGREDEADQIRTMPKKHSKKQSSSATLIGSSATLTTVVGSSQTGSLTTLDSSHASLPIRLPPVRPPPRPPGAPRGILPPPRRPAPRGSSQPPPPRPNVSNMTLKALESRSSAGSSDASSVQRGLSPGSAGWKKKFSMPLSAR